MDKGDGDKFFLGVKRRLSTEPCQLPVVETIIFFLDNAKLNLKAFVTASVPELQNMKLFLYEIIFFKISQNYLL